MSLPATYLSSTAFTVPGDVPPDIVAGVRIKASCGADGLKYGTVSAATYSAPNTTITVSGDALTSNLTEIWYGNDTPQSLPNHAAQHATGGRDALTAAQVGAVPTTQIGTSPGQIPLLDENGLLPPELIPGGATPVIPTPTILSPAAGSTVETATPTITGSAYRSLYGVPQAGLTVQIAMDSGFGTIIYTGTETGSAVAHTVAAGYILAATTYYLRLRYDDEDGGQSAWSPTVSVVTADSFNKIIGVALITAGGGGGTWAWVNAAGDAITPAADYFNSHPVFGGVTDVTVDGQAMVRIPKFYVKRVTLAAGTYSGKEAWFVSDTPATGFHLHPAFYNASAEVAQIYVGKYQASSDGTKLKSVSGVLPAVSTTLTAFQGLATARNVSGVTGFMLWSVYHWSAIQWLYLVEMATMDSQTKTGAGRTSASSAANVDAADVAQATYRGIVGLWGNVYQWMDGLKTDGTQICLWDNAGNKTWVTTGRSRTAAAGTIYPLTFMAQSGASYNFADVFVGDTGPTSNSGATAPDQQYFDSASVYFPFVGGCWSDSSSAGLWYVYCFYAASGADTSIGARLAKV